MNESDKYHFENVLPNGKRLDSTKIRFNDGNDIIDGSQANLTPGLSGVRYEGYFNDKFEFFENAQVIEDSRYPKNFTAINKSTAGFNYDNT